MRGRLAGRGYAVAILSSSGKGEALAEELGGIGVTGSNLVPADLERLVERSISEFGRIDAVVNSAGHGPKGPLLEISDEDWHLGMDVYLLNVVRMCRLVTPVMETQGKGAIVNISTYAAFEPESFFPTSGVFRAGLAAYTKLFTDRYGAANIRMNNILPASSTACPSARSSAPAFPWSATEPSRRSRHRRLPGLRRGGLHHRAEPPRRRRHHPFGLKRA